VLTLLVVAMAACQQGRRENGHLQHIENGLLTAIVLHGQPAAMKLTERMTYYRVPGVSIAIVNDRKIESAKGYGVLEARGTNAVTILTLFQAASISKPVAAMAALSLVQAGKLSLDENVNLQLRSWQVPDNEFTKDQKVTLRRLLNHSAGMTVEDVGSYAADEPLRASAARTMVDLVLAIDGIVAALGGVVREGLSASSDHGSHHFDAPFRPPKQKQAIAIRPEHDPPVMSSTRFVSSRDGTEGDPFVNRLTLR